MLWLLSFLLEIVYFNVPFLWRYKLQLGLGLAGFIVATSFIMPVWYQAEVLALGLLLPFRLLNIARVLKNRMHSHYLRRMTRRTSWWLIVAHIVLYGATIVPYDYISTGLPWVSLGVSVIIIWLLVLHLYKTRHLDNKQNYSDKELPTVSVCIPARNETDSLEQCLRSIIANDYPKLEILVLDDCSQDRTSEIIKSFAHDGVRFVLGDPPEDRWLAKNQAYNKLATEASGELLLFCGVDLRLGPHAIRSVVTTMLNREKSMISVMPLRFYSKLNEAFIQPMRYWWELVPPRMLFNRPAVLSTCWLVDSKAFAAAGGFGAVTHAIIPEGYFARHFIKDNRYSFIRADEELDIRTAKPFNAQWSTAIRTNYPQIRRRPEMALLLTVFTLLFMVWPFIAFVYNMAALDITLAMVSLLNCLLLTLAHVLVLQYSDPGNVPIAFITLPVAALMEVFVGYTSMLKYEFGSVQWKDRNVCIPVMHTIPKRDFLKQLG